MANHMIELKKVSKFYSNKDTISTGFSRVDLTLDIGEFVAITGESGSGKSTLLNVISGLDSYEEGEMFVGGKDTSAFQIEDYEQYRKTYIGNIFQDFNLVNSYTVYQNIELVMLISGKNKDECKETIMSLIELVGLQEFTNSKASKLSGGQKQRVAIARALAKNAPIIVADEPTGNLDSESAALVMQTLKKISKSKLVIIVTHNYEQAEPFITRKITMHDGKIVEDRRIETIESDAMVASDGKEESEVNISGDAEDEVEEAAVTGRRASRIAASGEDLDGKTGDVSLYGSPDTEETDEEDLSDAVKEMTKKSQLMLGVRNTFNLAVKFMLLLIIYLFVSTSVIDQYASTKADIHDMQAAGQNEYFKDLRVNRILVTKSDKTAFTDDDIKKIKGIDLVKNIVNNDVQLDVNGGMSTEETYLYGSIRLFDESTNIKPKYGRVPQNDNEVMIVAENNDFAKKELERSKDNMIGKEYALESIGDYNSTAAGLLPEKSKIVGIAIIEPDKNKTPGFDEICTFYVNANSHRIITANLIAKQASLLLDYNGKKQEVKAGGASILRPTDKVPAGQAYIFETQVQNYKNGVAKNKPLNITAKGLHETKSLNLKVGNIVDSNNAKKLLGIDKDYYQDASSHIYINTEDYYTIFTNANYQVSAFSSGENDVYDAAEALKKAGFTVRPIKDTLTNPEQLIFFVLRLLKMALLVVEFVVMFFIAYAVVRLIMKSRNTYYSTLRILGATRKNTDNILKIELVLMAVISFVINLIFIVLVKTDIIKLNQLKYGLSFIYWYDYVILFAALILLSLLIAGRYSRKIFSKSAMSAYREEI